MSLKSLCGIPGCGKTFSLTYLAVKHYKRQNSFFYCMRRKLKGQPWHVNNVYTSYPVLLDKKKKIYSRKIHIDDLKNQWSFESHAFMGFDEPQLDYDSISDTFLFPRAIGMTLQAHRHFGIDDIVFATQHPNRLIVYEKNIMNEYYKIMKKIKFPFLPWGIIFMRKCYEIEDYTYITTRSKTKRQECSISRSIKFFNFKKIGSSYDSTYLRPLNIDKPKLDKGTYNSLIMPKDTCAILNQKFLDHQDGEKVGKKSKKTEPTTFARAF